MFAFRGLKTLLGQPNFIWGIPLPSRFTKLQGHPEEVKSDYHLNLSLNASYAGINQMIPRIDNKITQSDMECDEMIGEDSRDKVFRLLGFKIFHLACDMDPTPESALDKTDPRYSPSPNYDTIRECRLVSKGWNDQISKVLMNAGKPVLMINPMSFLQKQRKPVDPVSMLQVINIPLVRDQELFPPNSDLPFPPFKLYLPSKFFYKEIELSLIHSWKFFEEHLYEIQFEFPTDSNLTFYWPQMNMRLLKKLKFKCTYDAKSKSFRIPGFPQNPRDTGYMHFIQSILNSAKGLENFTLFCYAPQFAPDLFQLFLPAGIKQLDWPLVKITPEEVEHFLEAGHLNGDCKSVKQITLRAPIQAYYRKDQLVSGAFGTFLVDKYGKSLEKFVLCISGQEMDHFIWSLRTDYVYEPLKIEFKYPLTKLTLLKIHAANWEISEMQSYQSRLPSLKKLSLTMISRKSQIEALYKSRSDTVQKLTLSFYDTMPLDVIQGFATNLPNLTELDVVVKESGQELRTCLYGFPKLKVLHLVYTGSTTDSSVEMFQSAVTGIPVEEIRTLQKRETLILEVMKVYGNFPSLRNLEDLEEFKLSVRGNMKSDVSIMLLTTFLRMPRLKRLILTEKTLEISDDEKDSIRRQNQHGLIIRWE